MAVWLHRQCGEESGHAGGKLVEWDKKSIKIVVLYPSELTSTMPCKLTLSVEFKSDLGHSVMSRFSTAGSTSALQAPCKRLLWGMYQAGGRRQKGDEYYYCFRMLAVEYALYLLSRRLSN